MTTARFTGAAPRAFALLAVVAGCGPAMPSPADAGLGPAKGDTAGAQAETHGLGEREHLLFRPHGNPSGLLGKVVNRSDDGKLTISEELLPGCIVKTRTTPERWRRNYVDQLKSVVGGSADFGEIARLQAEFGAEARVEVSIQNVERLDADLEGDCGGWLVTSVRVGTGSRFVGSRDHKTGEGGVSVAGVGTKASAATSRDQTTSFSWEEPQAWVFTTGRGNRSRRIELNAAMPTELSDGQKYRVTVLPNHAVWLLAYYREEDGTVGKLLPNMDHPVIAVAANERRELPELQAGLRDPQKAAQEWLVLCAFDDPDYVARFGPPKGDPSPAQMRQWAKELDERLEPIGRRHYRCDEIGYRITPAPRAADALPPGKR